MIPNTLENEDEKLLWGLLEKYNKFIIFKASHRISDQIYEQRAPQRELERIERKKRADELKEKKRLRGEDFKKILKLGDIVKVEGTKDGTGIREIMELDENRITTRKIILSYCWKPKAHQRKGEAIWVRDTYITTHMWNKIETILFDIKIEE